MSEKNAILLDFGSTFTKAAVVNLADQRIVYKTKAPSTVNDDAKRGLSVCYSDICSAVGRDIFENSIKLATSSAAGGLRMAVIGLTPTLSIACGRNAAFGAGAKILKTCGGQLTDADISELETLNIEIVLLCGGYEGGNTTMVLQNAEKLAQSACRMPVIYAGNTKIQKQIKLYFQREGKELFVVDNILPSVGVIHAEPAEEVIRNIFLGRIANMKGLDKVRQEIDRLVMPTPASVLMAGELLSLGVDEEEGLGALAIVDIGGATTDIHSYCYPLGAEGAKMVGTPEPYGKRTVEGDLGMRESSGLVFEAIGYEQAEKDLHLSETEIRNAIEKRIRNIRFLPGDDENVQGEKTIDLYIAKYAARIAMRRHAGHIETVGSGICPNLQYGKNLESVRTIIGTGGPLISSSNPSEILKEVFMTERDKKLRKLLPYSGRMMIDEDYVLYAAGLLRAINPKAALRIMKNSLREV